LAHRASSLTDLFLQTVDRTTDGFLKAANCAWCASLDDLPRILDTILQFGFPNCAGCVIEQCCSALLVAANVTSQVSDRCIQLGYFTAEGSLGLINVPERIGSGRRCRAG
jgi:hypothetical protein